MAKQKRKSAKSKPITAHPLFPAVVALWFGSLFGLGSLAIRPSLLESVVVKAGIDLVVPAAGPPLGVTARILLALALAAIGAATGALIGRRIARPKPVVRQRRRGAGTIESEEELASSPYNDNPVFAAALIDETEGANLSTRRRSLAISEDETDFVPHDMAPLPGSGPQVFDIAGLQLGGLEAGSEPEEPVEALDLGTFAEPPAPTSIELDWNAAPQMAATSAPVQAAQEPAIDTRQVFVPHAAPEMPADVFDEAPAGRQVFGQPPVETADALPSDDDMPRRQIFGVAVEGDHVSQDFVKAAGFKTTVFEVEEPAPLFPGRLPVDATHFNLLDTALQQTPDAAEPQPAAVQQPAPAETALATILAAQAPSDDAAMSSLGMTDLAHRLAQSMERRRAARAAATAAAEAAAAQPPVAASLPNAAEGIGALAGAEVLDSVPAPFAPAAVVAAPADQIALPAEDDALADDGTAEASAAPLDFPSAEPVAAFEPARFETRAPDFSNTFTAPVEPQAHVPIAPLAMPAALRPLDFDTSTNDELGLDSLLPPRRISMPTMPSAAGFHASAIDQEAADAIASEALEPEEDPATTAADFGSLVDLGANLRTSFVRINEPEAPSGTVEPVVIFPGQAPVAPFAPFAAAPAAPVDAEAAQFRRFDAPASAGQGQPVEVSGLESALDPAEAERSLRSALANLQRMSGAA